MENRFVIVRGGGDLATGTVQALWRAGFFVLILEAERPSAIRRQVALSEAVYDGLARVEDVTCVRCRTDGDIQAAWQQGYVPLLIDPEGLAIGQRNPAVVVDAILAKRNLGTRKDMAPCVIASGPGFTAGTDADYVIETQRGHNLGRILTKGAAAPNTGVPGTIAGASKERVMHSPAAGFLYGLVHIGDTVEKGQAMALLSPQKLTTPVTATTPGIRLPASLTGLVRGLIRDGYAVTKGFKIADIDPRQEELKNCFTVSDKARCLGGAVVTAILMHQSGRYTT